MDTRHAGDAHKHRAASACVAAGENDPANRHAGAVSGLSLVAAPRAHRTGWPGDATLGCLTAVVVASVAAALWLWCPIAPINTVPLPPLTPRPRPVLPAAFARLADVADATADLGAWLSGVQPLIDDSLLDPSTAVAPCYDEYAEWCHHVRQWASVGESIQAALLSIIHDVVIGTVSVMRAIRPLLEQARLDFNRENKGRACRGVEGVVAAVIDPAKAVQTAHEELEAVLPRILDMATESTQRGEALQRLWMKLKRRPRFLRSLDRMLRERAQSQEARLATKLHEGLQLLHSMRVAAAEFVQGCQHLACAAVRFEAETTRVGASDAALFEDVLDAVATLLDTLHKEGGKAERRRQARQRNMAPVEPDLAAIDEEAGPSHDYEKDAARHGQGHSFGFPVGALGLVVVVVVQIVVRTLVSDDDANSGGGGNFGDSKGTDFDDGGANRRVTQVDDSPEDRDLDHHLDDDDKSEGNAKQEAHGQTLRRGRRSRRRVHREETGC